MNIPPYEGYAMSVIRPLARPIARDDLQMWIWYPLWDVSMFAQSLEEIREKYESQGWLHAQYQAATYITQLYQTTVLVHEDSSMDLWYKPSGREHTPVVLAFTLPMKDIPAKDIAMFNVLPVPNLGEYALVEEDHKLSYYYNILNLPLASRQRYVELGEHIRQLSQPLQDWAAWSKNIQIAANETAYTQALVAFDIQRHLAITQHTQEEIQAQRRNLEHAHKLVEQLRTSINDNATWSKDWQEVQAMAQELAHDYMEYHKSQQKTAMQSVDEAPITTNRRKPKQQATPIVAKKKEEISVSSHVINREIINSLRDPSAYKLYEKHLVAEHRHKFNKDKGQIVIAIRPQEGEGWETILHAINTLGDECIDTYVATMAIALDKNGTDKDRLRTAFLISPDDILAVRGKVKSHGSYTPFQRAEVVKHLKTLSLARVIATMPGPRRRVKGKMTDTTIKADGAIIDLLSFKIGEYTTITGEEIWEKRSIIMGEWVTMIPEMSKQTATMLRDVLAYSAKNERYQKRLGIYLTFMFRINAKRGGTFPNDITMSALLEGAGIVAPRQRGEFKEAIENALACLKKDQVIGDYWEVVDESPSGNTIAVEVQEHARGWFDLYLQQKWNFSPPAKTLEQYKNLLKEPSEED